MKLISVLYIVKRKTHSIVRTYVVEQGGRHKIGTNSFIYNNLYVCYGITQSYPFVLETVNEKNQHVTSLLTHFTNF